MEIVKSNGQRVEYDPEKIRVTLKRAGATGLLIDQIVGSVTDRVRDGMTTRQVFTLVRKELRRTNRRLAHRYNLRNALLKLGPAGFKFEKYVASILAAYQYKVTLPPDEIPGMCVDHEVDVIAEKNGRAAMIEAKFRNRFGDTVNLKDTMATWSAFLDLAEGCKNGKCQKFDEVWIVTNGKFSERALQFGVCRGIRMVGWGGDEHSLARLVDHATLYPITILDDLRAWELEGFSENNLMLCREIADRDPGELAGQVKIEDDRAKRIVNACRDVIALD